MPVTTPTTSIWMAARHCSSALCSCSEGHFAPQSTVWGRVTVCPSSSFPLCRKVYHSWRQKTNHLRSQWFTYLFIYWYSKQRENSLPASVLSEKKKSGYLGQSELDQFVSPLQITASEWHISNLVNKFKTGSCHIPLFANSRLCSMPAIQPETLRIISALCIKGAAC